MNYGYDETSEGWKEERKLLLAQRLSEELPCPIGRTPGGTTPYIEVDELYPGVRVRRLTAIADEDVPHLVARMDAIYKEVMDA